MIWTKGELMMLMLSVAAVGVSRGEAPPADRLTPHSEEFTVTRAVSVDYLLYLPDGYESDATRKWPMVVFLHGAGERGDDLAKVKIHGPARYVAEGKSYPFILIAPQCAERRWWDAQVIVELVERITRSYRVDPERVYLTGLSMGGFGTWSAAALAPDRFAAIAPVCGGGEPEAAAKLKNVPVWAFHGGKDPVVPVKFSQDMVDAINAAGGGAKLTVYPDAGHDSWTETYENPELYKWLLSHRRSAKSEPRTEVRGDGGPDAE